MARMSKSEVIALAEEAMVRGDANIWPKVIDDARDDIGDALSYLRSCVDPEEQPPFKGWRCERCGRKLPRSGFVWEGRQRSWKAGGKETSGYYCDPCADAREQGLDR